MEWHTWPQFFCKATGTYHPITEKNFSVQTIPVPSHSNLGSWAMDSDPNSSKGTTLKNSLKPGNIGCKGLDEGSQAEFLHSDGLKAVNLISSVGFKKFRRETNFSRHSSPVVDCFPWKRWQMPPQSSCVWLCQHLQKQKTQLTVKTVSILRLIKRN